jgi:excisionase family DNA binding protein
MDPAYAGASDGPRAYSINDTADRIGVSRSKLYQLFDEEKLTYIKIGKRRLVEVDEIRRFLAAHRVVR